MNMTKGKENSKDEDGINIHDIDNNLDAITNIRVSSCVPVFNRIEF